MPFSTEGHYTPTHKVWDHVGNATPQVEHSEGQRGAFNHLPAAWLPVRLQDKYYEEWVTITTGKIVACDNQSRVCPGQYGLAGASITYTSTDVDEGVTDVRTGVALLSADVGTFTVASVSDFMGTGEAMSVTRPIGVASYNYFNWAGGDGSNPANFRRHNHILQSSVAALHDYVLRVPLVPAVVASAEALTFAAPNASSVSAATALANLPVAANTTRTPFTFAGGLTASNHFANQVSAVADIASQGDWHVNLTTGVISTWASAAPTGVSVTYYHYASAPTSVSRFVCAVGDLRGGDFVKCDANSNFQAALEADDFKDILGQVLGQIAHPQDALDRVRSAYNPAIGTTATGALPGTLGQLDQMPGSATGGVPDSVHYAGAADVEVVINLISR